MVTGQHLYRRRHNFEINLVVKFFKFYIINNSLHSFRSGKFNKENENFSFSRRTPTNVSQLLKNFKTLLNASLDTKFSAKNFIH